MSAVKILSILLSVYLVGCATASGPKFSGLKNPGETKAIVYVYREHDFDSRTSYPYFFINDEMKMPIRDKGYNLYPLVPGKYEFKVSKGDSLFWGDKDLVLTKEIIQGNRYFYELQISAGGSNVLYVLREVSEIEALKTLKDLNLSE